MRSPVCRDSLWAPCPPCARRAWSPSLWDGQFLPSVVGHNGLGKGQGHGPHENIPFIHVFLLAPVLTPADELGGAGLYTRSWSVIARGTQGLVPIRVSLVHMPFLVLGEQRLKVGHLLLRTALHSRAVGSKSHSLPLPLEEGPDAASSPW